MEENPGHIKRVLLEISNDICTDEILELKFLCRYDKYDCQSEGHCSLDEVDYCITMSNAEENHILTAVGVIKKRELDEIKTAFQLLIKLQERTGQAFNSVGFIKSVIFLMRLIRREDLVRKLMPFLTWSCHSSRQGTPTGSRRHSIAYLPTQAGILDTHYLQTDAVDFHQVERALNELLRLKEKLPMYVSRPRPGEYLCGNFPLPALIFFIFIFMFPSLNSMTYIYDNYIHPPTTVMRDHTDVPVETKKELLGRPVLYGLTPPAFAYKHDISLHSENVRRCLAKHQRCLIKGFFGEGKSHALSFYIHESIGKYPAGIIWLREWKDIAAVADVIASHRGTDILIRKEAAAAYVHEFLWNSSGWLLTIQDEHLWDSSDFKRVLNLFLNLESTSNHVIITSHRIPEALHDSIKVYEFNAGVHVRTGSCYTMVEDIVSNSISLTDEEKKRLFPVWETASCNHYAVKRITNFINEWNFTIEGFVSHWNELTKNEWLEMLGFGPKSQALFTEMKILEDLKERHPGVINFILDYIKTGKVKYEIPNCKLNDRYKGESLLFILAELRDLSLADVVINRNRKLCSVQMPALLRLLIEVTFLMKEDKVERVIRP